MHPFATPARAMPWNTTEGGNVNGAPGKIILTGLMIFWSRGSVQQLAIGVQVP
eukprot:SAG25_NODE_295_length_10249_cov_5.144926_6_plen_53_part_00